MAMAFDVGAFLGSHMAAKSPEAKLTGRVVTTAFAKEVDEISDGGVTRFTEGSASANKQEKAGDLTPEDAQLVKDTLRELMIAKREFAVAHYKGV